MYNLPADLLKQSIVDVAATGAYTKMKRLAQLILACAGVIVDSMLTHAQDTIPVSPRWAIAIHGGAGGNAATWDEEKRQAKLDGLKSALEAGRLILVDGGTAIDAVEAAVRVLEDNRHFNAGRGAVLTSHGTVELDASIMDGSSLACGAVASVQKIKNPIALARRVMTQTPHVLLVGEGAEEFARQQAIPWVDPDYFISAVSGTVEPDAPHSGDPSGSTFETRIGTVGCVAFDRHGNLAAATSTGGTSRKMPGRVGDSPIIGAGTYAANDCCAVSGTGIGEEFIRHSVAYDLAAQMRYAGRSLSEAVEDLFRTRLKPDVGGLIAVAKDGTIVLKHNTPTMSCGAADSQGRFEVMLDTGKREVQR
jgi:beta-aspartyl-peptidase (threonine type)